MMCLGARRGFLVHRISLQNLLMPYISHPCTTKVSLFPAVKKDIIHLFRFLVVNLHVNNFVKTQSRTEFSFIKNVRQFSSFMYSINACDYHRGSSCHNVSAEWLPGGRSHNITFRVAKIMLTCHLFYSLIHSPPCHFIG